MIVLMQFQSDSHNTDNRITKDVYVQVVEYFCITSNKLNRCYTCTVVYKYVYRVTTNLLLHRMEEYLCIRDKGKIIICNLRK